MDSLSPVGRLAHAGRAAAIAARDALWPVAARERASRLAVYVHCEPLARQRRVVDVCCGRGWGAAHLAIAGAKRVIGLGQPERVRRAAQRFDRPGLEYRALSEPLPDLGDVDLVVCTRQVERFETAFERVVESMAPGSQLVLASSPGVMDRWRKRLQAAFLSVEPAGVSESPTGRLELLPTPQGPTILEIWIASAPRRHVPAGPLRLHIGSGSQRLEGWVNVDIRPFPGVDLVADVTRGLEFARVDAVYAEHFLEHLAADDALDFLTAIHRMLTPEGCLRLSTPNLDWVWSSHYGLEGAPAHKVDHALKINRAFHGWEHKFLWNGEILAAALTAIGFTDLRWYRHGESDDATFRGLERHETYGDSDELPHVLIVEARRGQPRPDELASLRERLQRVFLDHVAGY
ncbi:MAG: hypothetical protein AAF560_27090 [Acidobacteriota bacterium]